MRASLSLVIAIVSSLVWICHAEKLSGDVKSQLKGLFIPKENKIILLGEKNLSKVRSNKHSEKDRKREGLLKAVSNVANRALNLLKGKRARRRTMTNPLPPTPTIPSQPSAVPVPIPQANAAPLVPVSPQEHCKDYCEQKKSDAKIDEIASYLKDVTKKAIVDEEKEKHKAEIKKEIEEAIKKALESFSPKINHIKESQPQATPLYVKKLENEIKQIHEALEKSKITTPHVTVPAVPAQPLGTGRSVVHPVDNGNLGSDLGLGSGNPIVKLGDQNACLKDLCKAVV